MNRKRKAAVAVGALVLLGGGIALAAGRRREPEQFGPPAPEDDDEPVTLDDIEFTSPGIPQAPSAPEPIDVVIPDVTIPSAPTVPAFPPDLVFTTQPVPSVPVPSVPVPSVPSVPPPVVSPGIPADTQAMVGALLAAERTAGWKRKESTVQAWQRARGLTQDGKFGPGSALKLALEVGTIPIVRFWPSASGSRPDLALDDYRGALELIAQQATPERALLLRASAERETGQSFGAPTGTNGKLPIASVFEAVS